MITRNHNNSTKLNSFVLTILLISLFVSAVFIVRWHLRYELNWIQYVILAFECYLFIFSTYYMLLTLWGWKKYKRNYKMHNPQTKFLIIVPSHNEEKVIAGIIQNLSNDIKYPKSLFDFYIIADNCTDKTAEIARLLGANVFENFSRPSDPKGKPYAIKAFLDANQQVVGNYDVLTIFDSDNIVHFDYFNEINSQFIEHKDTHLIQCRVLSKNPDDNYISGGYALSESFMNRFYTIPKQILGMNTTIQGTGFNVRIPYIQKVGWNPKSITEDFEFQVEMSNLNKRSQFNPFAYIYDEKPVTSKNSLIQRLRWSRGHWNVAISNTFTLMKSILKYRTLTSLDTFFYSFNMSRTLLLGLSLVISFASLMQLLLTGSTFSIFTFYSVPYIAFVNLVYNVVMFYVAYREQVTDKKRSNIFSFIASYVWFTITYLPLHVIALLSFRNQSWKRTEKSINISLNERLTPHIPRHL